VIHPKATILALQGPISIGSNCIIEETVVIVNRQKSLMKIGDSNLFEVGCRIEAASIGSNNVFEVRSKVAQTIGVGSFCTIGAGCTVLPQPLLGSSMPWEAEVFGDDQEAASEALERQESTDVGDTSATTGDDSNVQVPAKLHEDLPDQTVVFGHNNQRRLWSGEGVQQQEALHAKHLEYLREVIPKLHKLKIVQGVRAPPPSSSTPPSTAPITAA
jgi:dynactin-6